MILSSAPAISDYKFFPEFWLISNLGNQPPSGAEFLLARIDPTTGHIGSSLTPHPPAKGRLCSQSSFVALTQSTPTGELIDIIS